MPEAALTITEGYSLCRADFRVEAELLLCIQHILEVGLFIEDGAGKGADRDHLLLVDAGVLDHMVNQLIAHILALQFVANLGVLDNNLIGSRSGIYDLGEDIAVFFDKVCPPGAFHFVLDKHKIFF